MLLFDPRHILIADGGQQFVRNIQACDWSVIKGRKPVRLKYCLRQKENIINFLNHYTETFGGSSNKILPSEKMTGGRVLIVKNPKQIIEVLKEEKKRMLSYGNIGYDMLVLANRDLIIRNDGHKSFALKDEMEDAGLLIWDGTNDDNRLEYSVNPDEMRVYQYESSRGLEGWTVCCLNFDKYIEQKTLDAKDVSQENTLLLESIEDTRKKYIYNWSMIPLTRPIDTLIITLASTLSPYSIRLLEMAKAYPDYVTVI